MSAPSQVSLSAFAAAMLAKHGPMTLTANARTVLERRYTRTQTGQETPEEMVARVAWSVAQAEESEGPATVLSAAERFYAMIHALEFLPNSPTLMNAGRRLGQLSACFVLPVPDSIDGIFSAVRDTAVIHQSGGGTGFSFSRLRPHGDTVGSTRGVSSGPVSFMGVFDKATETIKQGGTRRGANMGILRVDHPDVLQFIDCKRDKAQLTNFNLSVALTEEFMKAVEDGTDYPLVNPKDGSPAGSLPAREVYGKIVEAAWRNGEPGIVFIDRMNRDNPTPAEGAFEATNPCGEQPLLPYESCNLGSVNLARMATLDAGIPAVDWTKLARTVADGVRFLDDVIDVNRYPLPEIERVTKSNRKIGLGVMGFADLLVILGLPYDSPEACDLADRLMGAIQRTAKEASRDLAEVRGSFPNFPDSTLAADWNLMRNATVTTIAPTGTISIIAGASSGVEPLFAVAYRRHVMDDDRLAEFHPLFETEIRQSGVHSDALMDRIAEHGTVRGIEEVPAAIRAKYATAHDVSPEWHVRMQAAFQAHVDNAVSKTVNFPADATIEDVRKVYDLAHRLGCKGVTVYRDGSRDEQVLSVGKEKAPETPAAPSYISPRRRPTVLVGQTREIATSCGKMYVTVNRDEFGAFEVFSQLGKAGGCAASQTEAIGRLASLALRSGVDPAAVAKQLSGISCHRPCGLGPNKVLSCAHAIGRILSAALESAPNVPAPAQEARTTTPAHPGSAEVRGACPDCGGQVETQEGCLKCRSCGFSECG